MPKTDSTTHPRPEPTSRFSDIHVEHIENIAIVRIARGTASNAVGPATMNELCAALDDAIADPHVKAIILGHHGKHFIAGADFSFLQSIKDASLDEIRNDIYRSFQGAAKRLYHCAKPTVAAIGGAAITVGCELAIACDFRVVTPQAFFRESWIKLGLIPPLGGMKKLPALVGYSLASEMILRARQVNGEEALAVGLASQLVPAHDLDEASITLAKELADIPPLAYEYAKMGLHTALEGSFEDCWSANLQAQSQLTKSDDFIRALDAVLTQRSS